LSKGTILFGARLELRSSERGFGCELYDVAAEGENPGEQFGPCAVSDAEVEVKRLAEALQIRIVRSDKSEARHTATGGSVDGGMNRVGAPFDEEGEEAGVVVFEIESFPLEETAVGAFAGARIGAVESETCSAQTNCECIEVAGMSGPADQARLGQLLQAVVIWHAGLQRIRRDDFEIVFFAER